MCIIQHVLTMVKKNKSTLLVTRVGQANKPSFPPIPVVCTRDTLSVPWPPCPRPPSLHMCINWYVTITTWAMYFPMCFSLNMVRLLHVPREYV